VNLITLDTGQLIQTSASTDGSFSAFVYAPAGTSILIKVDQSRQYTVAPNLNFAPLPGTIVRVPDPSSGGGTISFAGAGALDAREPPQLPAWTFQGTLAGTQFHLGDPLRVLGTLSIVSAALQASSGTLSVRMTLGLEKLSNSDGSPAFAQSALTSTVLTPTGLPIERSVTGERTPMSGSLGDRLAALDDATRLPPAGSVAVLARALGDPSGYVRERAATLLVTHADPASARDALVLALADEVPTVRRAAVRALVRVPDAVARDALARAAANDADAEVRALAAVTTPGTPPP
jgi:hypothetical protein